MNTLSNKTRQQTNSNANQTKTNSNSNIDVLLTQVEDGETIEMVTDYNKEVNSKDFFNCFYCI